MRSLLIAVALCLLMPAAFAGEGDPRGEPCHDPKTGAPCTDVPAGQMSCMPREGAAEMLSHVVGSADSGTFELHAVGTNHQDSASVCTFELRVRPADATFDATFAPGIFGSPGEVTSATSTPCATIPGQVCDATASFTWWRAVHGVTFDVPFDLVVDGQIVATGSCHYFDPPAMETVTGGPVVVAGAL